MIRTKFPPQKVVDLATVRKGEKWRRKQAEVKQAKEARLRAVSVGFGVLLTYFDRVDEQHPMASLESLPEGAHWNKDLTYTVGRMCLEIPELVDAVERVIGGGLPRSEEVADGRVG